jgi:hypothetical protein
MVFCIHLSPPPGLTSPYSTAHLLLIILVLGISAAAWKIPMMGGVLFFIFGLRFYVMVANASPKLLGFAILSVMMLTAILFIGEGYLRSRMEI